MAAGAYTRADRLSGGVLGVFHDSFQRFTKLRGAEAAASMAYYTIFSLFPFLLFLVAIGSFFLESERVQDQVLQIINLALPVGRDLVTENIREVFEERGALGWVGGIGLLWSASAAFTTLFRNINRAWLRAGPLSTLKSRMIAVALIVGLVVLLLAIRFSSALINLLPVVSDLLGENGQFFETFLWTLLSSILPMFLTFLIFLALYRWIPNTRVRWTEAFWAALLAAVAWEVTTNVFTWYLSSGLVNYRLVYGSLGTMIALLFWIYLNSVIVIYCAHLSAAIARKLRPLDTSGPEREDRR